MSRGGGIPAEALLDLRRRLDQLPPRHPERKSIIEGAVQFYGLSRASVYRALQGQLRPQGVRRTDHGSPRKITRAEMERYCEIIAALKIRTSNKKGRHVLDWLRKSREPSDTLRSGGLYGAQTLHGRV